MTVIVLDRRVVSVLTVESVWTVHHCVRKNSTVLRASRLKTGVQGSPPAGSIIWGSIPKGKRDISPLSHLFRNPQVLRTVDVPVALTKWEVRIFPP